MLCVVGRVFGRSIRQGDEVKGARGVEDEPRRADVMALQAKDIDVEPLSGPQVSHDKANMVDRFDGDVHRSIPLSAAERPKLSDPARGRFGLQPPRDGRIRCSA